MDDIKKAIDALAGYPIDSTLMAADADGHLLTICAACGAEGADNASSAPSPSLQIIHQQRERIERLERILAAERGEKGLDGWKWSGCNWLLSTGQHYYIVQHRIAHGCQQRWEWFGDSRGADLECAETYSTAIEAMDAAEAALRGTP